MLLCVKLTGHAQNLLLSSTVGCMYGQVLQKIYPKAPSASTTTWDQGKWILGWISLCFASLGAPVLPPSACFLRKVGGWTCRLMQLPRPLAAACSGCPSTKGRSPAEMRAVGGMGVTCENTVTRQDRLHLRELNMGRKVTQTIYTADSLVMTKCWQQIS